MIENPQISKSYIDKHYVDKHYEGNVNDLVIASPWRRILAQIVNVILQLLCGIPLFVALLLPQRFGGYLVALGTLSAALLVVLLITHLVWMHKRGQSVGKRVVGIRVARLNGDNPGIFTTFFVREIFFSVFVLLVSSIIAFVFSSLSGFSFFGTALADISNFLIELICLIMLFIPGTKRRTLQDYLAKTMVVEV